MSRLYALFRRIARRWIWLMLALVATTFGFGMIGFAYDNPHHWGTDLYLVSLLFLLNCGEVARDVNPPLEWARWLGLATWFTTVAAVLVRLFSDRILEWFVWGMARNHVIVAGLGEQGEELVVRLRRRGENVVVLASGADSAQFDTCRDAGAVVLAGSPAQPILLRRARLDRAKLLLVLFDDDRTTLQVAAEAFRMLQAAGGAAGIPSSKVRCVAKLTEPGLQDVLRHHDLYRRRTDSFALGMINLHELASRSMLSLARSVSRLGSVRRFAVLGLGERGRMAETLVLRAVKDALIDRSGSLEIHLYDLEAERFARELPARFPFVRGACDLCPHPCPAERCGIDCDDTLLGITEGDFDAAFICVGDESRAAVQAAQLGRFLGGAPVVVLCEDSRTGLGALLRLPEAGGLGRNVHPVGFLDPVLDPDTVMRPRRELLARACHEGYLSTLRTQIFEAEARGDSQAADEIRRKPANVPWERLSEGDRASNHGLVSAIIGHLRSTHPTAKPVPYRIEERLSGHVGRPPEGVHEFSPDEVEFLAAREHDRWMEFKKSRGWKCGLRDEGRKHHPNMIPYDRLDDATKDLDREIVRRLPSVLARADFVIRRDDGHGGDEGAE